MFRSNLFTSPVGRSARRRSLRSLLASSKAKTLSNANPQAESLEPRLTMAADPVISEFQAVNVSTIKDKFGDYSDWVEIRNPDVATLDVSGWYLTDDSANLTQWRFPANTTIPAGKQILVFASGRNLATSGEELHTNFKLSADGEFLGLVRPDGRTITQSYNPYPPQVADQSYGQAITRDSYPLVPQGATAKVFVPTSDIGNTWTQVDYIDGGWTSGKMGVGYETLATGTRELEEFNSNLGQAWTRSVPADSASNAVVIDGVLRMTVPASQDVTSTVRGQAPMVYRTLPGAWHDDYEIITSVTQGSADRGIAGIAIINPQTGLPVIQLEYNSRTNFRMLVNNNQKATINSSSRNTYLLRIVRDSRAGTYTGFYKLAEADPWVQVGSVKDGVDGISPTNNPLVGMYARTPTSVMTADFAYFDVVVPNERPTYGPLIGLNLDSAMRNKNSSVYVRIPFTYNGPTNLDELDLTAWFDDGFRAFLNGTELTSENAPINTTWNSDSGADHGAVNGVIPESQYSVAKQLSALRQGNNVLALQGMNVSKDNGDFFLETRLTAAKILSATNQPFITPTPGAPNLKPAAPTPQIIGQQGTFFGSTVVTLAIDKPAPGLEIRYTLNGADPTTSSTLYTGPITLNKSAMLQARTFDSSLNPNFVSSNIAAGTFVCVDNSLKERSSDLPLLILDTVGQGLASASTNSLTATDVVLFDVSQATGRSKIGGSPIDYLGRGGLRDRGSSTAGQPKPNMAFETWGKEGNTKDDDEATSLLGMPADADWVLHAPLSFDAAMVRNEIAVDLSRQMGMWASRYRLVEVYFNRNTDGLVNETDYYGVYVLMEKIKQDDNRVDIKEITPSDNTEPNISGGYIWKVDREDPDAPPFTAGGQGLNWVYPKSPVSKTGAPDQKATAAQQTWVTNYFNEFRKTLTNPNINDPLGYSKYIDPANWVDNHLINVFMMNVDALRLSAYLYKDRGERVKYGPVWDFDRSAESADDRDDNPFVWRSQSGDLGTDFFGNGTQQWWGDLFKDPGFWQLYVDRWQEWRKTVLSDANVGKIIDGLASQLRESQVRNAVKWTASRPRSTSGYKGNVLNGSYQGEIDNIKKWLKDRASFMDNNFAKPARLLANGQFVDPMAPGVQVAPGAGIEIQSPPLEFYNDTALVSGVNGAASGKFFVPVNDDLGTSWAQPNFNDAAWTSGKTGVGYQDGITDFTELLSTTVDPRAADPAATTVLVRVPFTVNNLTQAKANRLILRAKFDDGYVAYLNGTEIRRANMRDQNLTWTARANTRSNTNAKEWDTFDISNFTNLLVQGTNVLAFRAVNSTATSNDLLLLPELLSREVNFGVNPKAKVYYTTDGTDPRGPDGQPSATAKLLPAGQKVIINSNTRIKARNFDDTDRGAQSKIVKTNWSGLLESDVITQAPSLVISEINYNPFNPTAAQIAAGISADDFEFVEIHNPTNASADLLGVKLMDGVEFDFASLSSIKTIAPGGYVVVVNNRAAFEQRYGTNVPIAGEFIGSLDNAGERVRLQLGDGTVASSVSYGDSDPWSVMADGEGATLELLNVGNTPLERQGKWYSWRGSAEYNGTPGTAGKGRTGVLINEVLARTEAPVTLTDSIELHNTTATLVNISGWFLSDSANNPFKYEIPAGTTIPAGGYIVFKASQFNAPNNPDGFSLAADGDSVYLTRGVKASKTVSEFIDDVHFGATLNGQSLGRLPNGSGRLAPLTATSLGAANSNAKFGPVVISELNYNPVANAAALAVDPNLDPADLEFIEIYNSSAALVDISGWHVRGGSDFTIPANTKLNPNELLVIVKFDPANPENAKRVSAFQAQYGIGPSVRLLGGYSGQLNNSDDRVTLLRPDSTADPVNPPYVLVDEVLYDDLAPWPTGADGTGQTLQRKSATAFGNAGDSWFAGNGTPGVFSTTVPGDFNGDGVLNIVDLDALRGAIQANSSDLKYDVDNNKAVNLADLTLYVESKTYMNTYIGDANLDRQYGTSDLVFVFAAGKYEVGGPADATWAQGDWNADGRFTTSDLVFAFQGGGYEIGPRPAVAVANLSLAGAALEGGASSTLANAEASIVLTPTAPTSVSRLPVADVDQSLVSLFADEDEDEGDADDDEAIDQLIAFLANGGSL